MSAFSNIFCKKEPKTITVSFTDVETGKVFAQSQIPVKNLPDSFEARTTFDIGEDKWTIERAEPMTKAEFGQKGSLDLWARKSQFTTVDPTTILFSLPTISDELPGIASESSKLNKHVLELHEDDWRQIEFVSLNNQAAIEQTLTQIRRIHQEERIANSGFRTLHVRSEIPAPLQDISLSLTEFQQICGPNLTPFDGIAFDGVAGLVENGFAFSWQDAASFFGLENKGRLEILCLHHVIRQPIGKAEIHILADFAQTHQLCLIDWCRAWQVMPQTDSFIAYFAPDETHAT